MLSWFALHCRYGREPFMETALAGLCETFWPHRAAKTSNRQIHRYPWFPGYLFVRADWDNAEHRRRIQTATGYLNILSTDNRPIAIPDQEIASLRALQASGLSVMHHPFVRLGDQVRVTRGPLAGAEGILARFAGQAMLVVQLELLGRAVATHIPQCSVETLARSPRPQAA